MGLITIPDIQNLDPATPELFNERYGEIVDEVNGNLDADNLADGAVTAPKLATNSVATAKVADAAITSPKWTNIYKFSVYRHASWTSADDTFAKVQFDTEAYDHSSSYDNATNYRFTAPVNGFYHFNATVSFVLGSDSLGQVYLYKNGAAAKRGTQSVVGTASVNFGGTISVDMQLVAGDYIEIFAYGSGGSGGIDDATFFSGHLISET